MNILVLGEKGMLAHVMTDVLKEKHKVSSLSLRDKAANFVDYRKYDVVVNCVGILVKESEIRKDRATYYNSHLPHYLSNHVPGKVIHISTDCVFDDTFYGRSKLLGEIDNSKDVTLRTSIIGPELNPNGTGLFNWFMQQEGAIQGYIEAIWSGITTLQLAKSIDAVIDKHLSGIYNLSTEKPITKYDLLKLLNNEFNRGLKITPVHDGAYKALVPGGEIRLPSYETMIKEMKEYIDVRPEKYSHYFSK